MKKAFTFLGSILVALGLKAHASVPAKKETSARPAIIKNLLNHSENGALQQKGKPAPATYKTKAPAKAAADKAPAQLKSAAVHKAPAPRTTHR
ncbi:MAG TPA: hypothetical protein VFE32_00675 [Puia sp.]|jgi:hypothetical protein|nr:hypothetical protein [Puia sp.]